MKNLFILIFSFTLISCGDISPKGSIESKDLPLEDFVNIDLDGKFRVFYVKSDSSFVNVETYPNVFNNLKINVEDKTLTIKEKRATKGVDFYNITLYSKYQPEKIKISDSVEINVSSEIKTDNFRLNLKNYAKFIGSVNARRAEVEMADRSQANFLGKSQQVNLKISDSASIIAPYWNIDNLKLESTDANYAEVNVKDSLKGSVKNTAKLVYYNNPIRAFKIAPTATVQNKKID
ncbi:GIN domain-containing protein [Kaistella pullorum]|uniref:DUF2807 domain-containing protein n=1 Tax=Kaistella pullorum TaxID=2763074 RepID=A0ABR8WNP3_9FLAO|nr:DUF2807 domain-containing protein [Kaistella pullorum]MBD8018291.1 DUF2807 domain-containing protein [Kaistella pullorum]